MADADGATPIVEVKRLEAAVQEGADLAVGSRALPDPSVVVQRAPAPPDLSGACSSPSRAPSASGR